MYRFDQTLAAIRNPQPIAVQDPVKRQQSLADLGNTMQAGQLQQQQLAAGADAASLRQSAQQKQANIQRVLSSPGTVGPDGTISDGALAQLGQIDPQYAATLMKAFGKDPETLSQNQRRADETRIGDQTRQTAVDTLTETMRKNAADEKLKADEAARKAAMPKTLKSAAGAFQLNDATGEYELIPGTEPPPKTRQSQLLTPEEEAQYLRLHPPSTGSQTEPGSYMDLRNDQGQVIGAWNPKSGEFKPVPEAAAGTRRSGVSAGTNQKIVDLENAKRKIDDLASAYKPEFVGPYEGRYERSKASGVLSYLPFFRTPEGYGDFAALNADIKNSVIKLITGAQMGVQEAQRILQQVPIETDKDEIWKSKYEQTKKNAEFLLGEAKRLSGAGGGTATVSTSPDLNPGSGITLDDIAKEKARRAAAKGK